MKEIGFIGLGIMGKPMSKNLLKAGYPLVVFDIVPAAVEEVVGVGAEKGTSAKDVAAKTDVIITMLPNSPHVQEVVLGKDGIIQTARPGAIVIDMSSISPLVSREIGAKLAEKGIRMLDAPVSGGEPKAIDGTLSIMVGGSKADFDEFLPMMKTMGASVVLCGEIGAGNVTKLANQIVVAANIAAVSEALVLAAKAGVNPDLVYQAIRGGLAGSTVMDAKTPMMLDRNFKPGFRINLHIKDLNNVLETARGIDVQTPLTDELMAMMQSLKEEFGDSDHSALVRYYEKIAGIELHR
ncbi:MAG: 2-hydroxy-3-oxopropionate reductase [Syntrophobacterales bacterium RBG_19FT_COMBO_59_10]|nr:MAG: 2-hydroxy-3-oxopropionate reductase [Syntrophobacterales bacterium RBG_19FT_COMBO_59_10]